MAAPLVIGGLAGAGGLMGAKGAKQNSQPTTTTQSSDPWKGGDANWFMDTLRGDVERARNIDWGTTGQQDRMFRQMMGDVYGGRWGGGEGGGVAGAVARGISNRGRGGGGGRNRNKWYTKNNVNQSDYEARVTAPEYMQVHDDPYLQAQQEYRRGLHDRNAAMSRSQALSPFAGNAATMGFTGAAMDTQSRMQQANELDWLGQENELFMGERDARRQQAMAANQAWSGRESAFDQAGIAGDATRAAANTAARANMYAADQRLRGVMAGVNSQNQAQRFGQMMQLYGLSDQRANQNRRLTGGLANMGLMERYGGATFPWQQGFGTRTGVTQPPQVSGLDGFLSGAAGGAMMGLGMGGFGGGGGGSAPVWGQSMGMNMPGMRWR